MANDPTLKRWLLKYSLRDQEKRLRVLDQFAAFTGRQPRDLLEETRRQVSTGPPQIALDTLAEFHDHLLTKKKNQPSTAALYISYLRTYFESNFVSLGPTPPNMICKPSGPQAGTPTQAHVKCIIEMIKKPECKAAVGFLAQTGQRISVLKALQWSMIERNDSLALVRVPSRSPDQHGRNTNKIGVPYSFVIGRDAMRLIDEYWGSRPKNGWVFNLSLDGFRYALHSAAKKCKLRKVIGQTSAGKKVYAIHAHTLRKYWETRMREGGVDSVLREYMKGHVVSAYDKFTDREILREYRKAQRKLSLF